VGVEGAVAQVVGDDDVEAALGGGVK
jgi:hypothetical protein